MNNDYKQRTNSNFEIAQMKTHSYSLIVFSPTLNRAAVIISV